MFNFLAILELEPNQQAIVMLFHFIVMLTNFLNTNTNLDQPYEVLGAKQKMPNNN